MEEVMLYTMMRHNMNDVVYTKIPCTMCPSSSTNEVMQYVHKLVIGLCNVPYSSPFTYVARKLVVGQPPVTFSIAG